MDIHTKFNIGDMVWIMRDNKPDQIRITNIEIEVIGETISGSGGILSGNSSIRIWYVEIQYRQYSACGDKDPVFRHRESNCFGTKKELLDSFLNEDEL